MFKKIWKRDFQKGKEGSLGTVSADYKIYLGDLVFCCKKFTWSKISVSSRWFLVPYCDDFLEIYFFRRTRQVKIHYIMETYSGLRCHNTFP